MAEPQDQPFTLPAVRKVTDPEERLAAYATYLDRVTSFRDFAIAERAALVIELRGGNQPPTFRHLSDVSGLSEGYIRRLVARKERAKP